MAQELSTDNLTFLHSANAEYVIHLYSEYLSNASKVDPSWREFFESLSDTEAALLQEMSGASWTPDENRKTSRGFHQVLSSESAPDSVVELPSDKTANYGRRSNDALTREDVQRAARDSIAALMMIRVYRVRGHLQADLDPLGLKEKNYHPELDPAHYGFTREDYHREIYVGGVLGMEYATLQEIINVLNQTYCGTIGVEFMHLSDPEEKSWIQQRIEEPRNRTDFTVNGKRAILQRLIAAEMFEKYLHKKYPGTKRFGVDGGEALIPAIEQIMKRGGQIGLKEIVIGMSHRGRLNVLANVMGKPYTAIFSEFQGQSSLPESSFGSGDVKYHLGTSSDRDFDGNNIHLSLTANPSHLEFVNPVVIGKVRAKQVQREDKQAEQVLPLLLHGDAAMAGQGITAETLMISDLPGYRVGGTIHIVVNNQIGFTTMPKFSRSGPYPTDVAKMVAAPIFHVNGDDPEAVVHASRIAMEFRQQFKKDVVIDIFCYRRFGHNEGDEPAFTQPLMYQKIGKQKTTYEKYREKLIEQKVVTEEEADELVDEFTKHLDESFKATEGFKPNGPDYLSGAWEGMRIPEEGPRRGKTGVTKKAAQEIGKILTDVPEGFNINSKLDRVLKAKVEMFKTGENFDWATAEALAFGTLLHDGYTVRLSGQDCGRGTFSHRHAIWYDQKSEDKYIPLANVSSKQPRFEVHDSPLSEMAVLGFEYGYSLADPKSLVLWEAQFGDFVNGAQVMIDQFIASGEIKWLRMSGLVMLLPHGYEGQGPEHSSARPERFLQMCAEDNWQVANCTTPANYFHILRRQMHRDFRKPLVLMTPKSLLRHKLAVSTLDEMTGDSFFHRYLWDDDHKELNKPQSIKRVVLCSGKVYYDLLQERRKRNMKDVYLLRLEQLYPFPMKELGNELKKFKNADIIWCQEEPKNQGAWSFVNPLLEDCLTSVKHKTKRAVYAGRNAAAAPATGLHARHIKEQNDLINAALDV